jgi:hypothetical protein
VEECGLEECDDQAALDDDEDSVDLVEEVLVGEVRQDPDSILLFI